MKRAVFTTGPWRTVDGDPANPRAVMGVPTTELVLAREGISGALLALSDGRYAITGRNVAVGSARQLKRHARRCLRHETNPIERGWYQSIAGELARRSPRPLRMYKSWVR